MSILKYSWKAIYKDGESLDQFNGDGTENRYVDIDRSKIIQFLLIDTTTGEAKVILHLKPGQQLIHRRRVLQRMALRKLFFEENPGVLPKETVYIIGWHENRSGVNVQMLLFVFENGSIEIMDRWREDHALYHPVILLPEEKLCAPMKPA